MSFFANRAGRKAVEAYNRQDYDEAQRVFDQAYKRGMDDAKLLYAYGLVLIQRKEYEKAGKILSEGIGLKPSNESDKSSLIALYAIALWKCGNIEKAIEALESHLRSHKNGVIYATLGYLLIEAGDNNRALQICSEALDYDDGDPAFLDNAGQLYYRNLHQTDLAEGYFKQAIQLKPFAVDSNYFLALIAAEKKDYVLASEHLHSALHGRIAPLNYATPEMIEKLLNSVNERING